MEESSSSDKRSGGGEPSKKNGHVDGVIDPTLMASTRSLPVQFIRRHESKEDEEEDDSKVENEGSGSKYDSNTLATSILTSGGMERRIKKRTHTRSKTADLSILRHSESAGGSSTGAVSTSLDSMLVGMQDGGDKDQTRMRRVHSEPKVVAELDITRRGLAHLESQDYSEILLTSASDEGGSSSSGSGGEEEEDGININDTSATGPSERESLSPLFSRSRRKKADKRQTRRKKKTKRKKNRDTVQVAYFKDNKGEVRDEYGFRVDADEPEYALTGGEKHAPVPHHTKKKILSKEARRVRQRRVWNELLQSMGAEISNLSSASFERWRKYYSGSKPEQSAELYLTRISAPIQEEDILAGENDVDVDIDALHLVTKNENDEFEDESDVGNHTSRENQSIHDDSKSKFTRSGSQNSLLQKSPNANNSTDSKRHSGVYINVPQQQQQQQKRQSDSYQGSGSLSDSPGHRRARTLHKIGAKMESVVRKLTLRKGKKEDEHHHQSQSWDPLNESHLNTSTGAESISNGYNGPDSGGEAGSPTFFDSPLPSPIPPMFQSGRHEISSNVARQVTHTIRHVGVPPRLRRDMWLLCSGALTKQRMADPSQQYEYLVHVATNSENPPEMAEIIERDLHRTFPTNYHFEEEEGITRMRRVLLAYSLRNRAIGYCQSMNFLVAVLLLHMEENLAFWVLAAIVEDLVPGHYTKQMTGMHVDQKVFESLVKQRLPKIHSHLESIDFPLEFVTYQWFLCLFVNSLPLETTLRIWDCFLHEGSKVLFRSGLAILMILQKDILVSTSFQEVYDILSLGDNHSKRSLLTGDKVLKMAYDPISFRSFPSSKISQLRTFHLPAVLDNLGHQGDWEDFRAGKPIRSAQNILNKLRQDRNTTNNAASEQGEYRQGEPSQQEQQPKQQQQGRVDNKRGETVEETIAKGHLENLEGEEVRLKSRQTKASSLSSLGQETMFEDDEDDPDNHRHSSRNIQDDDDNASFVETEIGAEDDLDGRTDEFDRRISYSDSNFHEQQQDDRVHEFERMRYAHSQRIIRDPVRFEREGSLSSLVKKKVVRRPSTSFKYRIRGSEDPKDALSRLGIMFGDGHNNGTPVRRRRGARPSSLSCYAPDEQILINRNKLPRRASTNSPLLLARLGYEGTFAEYLGKRLANLTADAESVGSGKSSVYSDSGIKRSSSKHRTNQTKLSSREKFTSSNATITSDDESYDLEEEFPPDYGVKDDVDPDIDSSGGVKQTLSSSSKGAHSEVTHDDEEEDDEEDDIPVEFSGLLPTLAYVMSAQQVNVEEGPVMERMTPRAIAIRRRKMSTSSSKSGRASRRGSACSSVASAGGEMGDDDASEESSSSDNEDIDESEQVRTIASTHVLDDDELEGNNPPTSEEDGVKPKRRRKRSLLSHLLGWGKK